MPLVAQTYSPGRLRRRNVAWLALVFSFLPTLYAWWVVYGCGQRPWWVLGGGLGLSAGLGAWNWRGVQRHRQAEGALAELQQRATELEKAAAESAARLPAASMDLVRFKAITDTTSDFINITDMDGRVLYLSPGARRLVGIAPEEDVTRFSIGNFTPKWVLDRFHREGFPAALRDGSWTAEVALLHRDGREIPVSFVGVIPKSAEGKPSFMACIARDMTQQRRAAAELQQALAEEKKFISIVSHEFRSPLALIMSSAEILARYLDRLPAEKRRHHLDTIIDAIQRMSVLVEEALMVSRAEAGRLEFNPTAFDPASFCQQLAEELGAATRSRCPIHLTIPEGLGPALGDPVLLRHILGNLLTNAVKYSPAGSPVTLRLERAQADAVFRVEDRGMGIPEADHPRLFCPFHRGANVSHIPGTGLGLMVVRRCVERHSGALEVQSREGAGTMVTVRLPLFAAEPAGGLQRGN